MSESPVELARVRDDSCCRVEDTLQLVGRLLRSANQETDRQVQRHNHHPSEPQIFAGYF